MYIAAEPHLTCDSPFQLGVIPGSGGTQRLTHAIGKSRAMEIVLTGRMFSAQEASDWGLVSRVVSDKHEETLKEAIDVAEKIASKGKISVQAAKEAVSHGAYQGFQGLMRDLRTPLLFNVNVDSCLKSVFAYISIRASFGKGVDL